MLQLKNITKEYHAGDTTVEALRGIVLNFRDNEFVSVLGPSGCGKTTLLNIVGGLDSYTKGDLCINGRSTVEYNAHDWDAYRNHSVGFVFQTYNLIPHLSVLANVELALTLSGVSKAERKERSLRVLEQVGLSDQAYKKPNQMSGGQMQRVAIARALVNDPDILLADEPTGALDSATSLQIMELLKEIAKDRLIIMVTHNPELAETYSTRIVRLLDGLVVSDSNPYTDSELKSEAKVGHGYTKTSMSFFTALSLSFRNLLTKKGRTILTAFAGSIGIIGIALILSLSSGVQNYISRVEEDTLSSYPLSIEQTSVDFTSMMLSMMKSSLPEDMEYQEGLIYSNDIINKMMTTMFAELNTNDLGAFMNYLEAESTDIKQYVTDIQYSYGVDLNIYTSQDDTVTQINPSTLFSNMGGGGMGGSPMGGAFMNTDAWQRLLDNPTLLTSQYDVLAGSFPNAYNEVVLIVDENNSISDYTLYSLGLKDVSELDALMKDLQEGNEVDTTTSVSTYSYDEIIGRTYSVVTAAEYYQEADGIYTDMRDDETYMKELMNTATTIEIVGILRPNQNAITSSSSGVVGYTASLIEYLIERNNQSSAVVAQLATPDTDIFTGLPFTTVEQEETPAEPALDMSTLDAETQAYLATLSEEELAAMMETMQSVTPTSSNATFDGNLAILGQVDTASPSSISIYPADFESKEYITSLIDTYNAKVENEGNEELKIQYTDYIGLLLTSVSSIINTISYVLIAFVAISLVVSSIMIGIITYISVLERTKEIGILRSIGASTKDISRVFNAETLLIGFVSGLLGIGVTALLNIPINLVINSLVHVSGIASLPLVGAGVLILISMILTFIAGLIPSGMAARKDPVVALRSE